MIGLGLQPDNSERRREPCTGAKALWTSGWDDRSTACRDGRSTEHGARDGIGLRRAVGPRRGDGPRL